eukprot:5361991-Amphidinium_carterae.1
MNFGGELADHSFSNGAVGKASGVDDEEQSLPAVLASREEVLRAVRLDGMSLEFTDEWCRHDPEIVLEALRENGMAL